ncbi:FAST kinase domain-containing protein 3, mitochondrial [Poecile atricapillus]|uniref:FAST kinase domain-containing protein 3, mitochondrial n=1 Tax=Poecile atricapillus TaxID=48891 RepID=UPI002739E7D4|nr:FAST kinase domain-containing protein 3, mitochondrial [Poecile atricapillus]
MERATEETAATMWSDVKNTNPQSRAPAPPDPGVAPARGKGVLAVEDAVHRNTGTGTGTDTNPEAKHHRQSSLRDCLGSAAPGRAGNSGYGRARRRQDRGGADRSGAGLAGRGERRHRKVPAGAALPEMAVEVGPPRLPRNGRVSPGLEHRGPGPRKQQKLETVLHTHLKHFEPYTLLNFLHLCVLIQCYPINFLPKIFSPYFLQKLQGSETPFKIPDTEIKLDEEGFVLPAAQLKEVHRRFHFLR